jgi:hypothetical protein
MLISWFWWDDNILFGEGIETDEIYEALGKIIDWI